MTRRIALGATVGIGLVCLLVGLSATDLWPRNVAIGEYIHEESNEPIVSAKNFIDRKGRGTPLHSAPALPGVTPLNQIRKELTERAVAGDAEAATQLFRETIRCIRAEQTKEHAQFALSKPLDPNMTEQQTQEHEAMLKRMHSEIEATEHICEGLDEDELSASAYPVMLMAAKLGDLDAAACYVGPGFDLTPEQKQPDSVEQYRTNALSLVDSGMEKGDWRIVGLMADAYAGGGFTTGWFPTLVSPDRKRAYAYTRLLRIGARGEYAAQLDRQLTAMAEPLSREDADIADAWAESTYQKYFRQTPVQESSESWCDVSN